MLPLFDAVLSLSIFFILSHLLQAMCATSPWQRRLCFLLPFTMRVLLTLLRLTRFGGGNNTSMTHVFLQVGVKSALMFAFQIARQQRRRAEQSIKDKQCRQSALDTGAIRMTFLFKPTYFQYVGWLINEVHRPSRQR